MPAAEPAPKTIGAINGPWAWLFKATLTASPLFFVWVSAELLTIKASRFTKDDGRELSDHVAVVVAHAATERARLELAIKSLPPRELTDRLIRFEERQISQIAAQDRFADTQKTILSKLVDLEKRVP